MGDAIRIGRERERATSTLMTAFREAMRAVAGTFDKREAAALTIGNEIVRRWIADELQAIADAVPDDVVVNGTRYRRSSEGTVRYHTLCGAVAVRRSLHRAVGVHNGPTVVPLELRAGLWANATPALAFSVMQGFAARPLRDYEHEMAAAPWGRTVGLDARADWQAHRAAVDATIDDAMPWIRAGEPHVDGVRSISVGLDRTTVPMAETIPDAGGQACRSAAARPKERASRS